MDPRFLTAAFWQASDVHIALPPNLTTPPDGLLEAAQSRLPEGGCLFLTSGTTGSPKWVALEKRALLHSARVVNALYDLGPKDHWLIALPLHHIGGFSILARRYLSDSKVSLSPNKWNIESFFNSLLKHCISVTSIVPTQLFDLVAAGLLPPPSLRLVLVGGGRLESSLLQKALQLGWPVCATYGLTEAASQVASQALEHDRLKNPETLEVLPHWHTETNADGSLVLKGPALAKGYFFVTDFGIEWEPISAIAGFQTRDHVNHWSHGTRSFVQFVGREQNIIKIVGELVSIETLEKRISALHPENLPAFAIVALPDARRENRLVLAIETDANQPPDFLPPLLQAYHESSAPFERIESVRLLPRLPRSELGKLSRDALKTQLMATESSPA